MGSCGNCVHFVPYDMYRIIYDGYCSLLRRGDAYKGVNRSNSCNNFTEIGFKGGCFLTSACTEYLGKSDDCEELTKLRAFRDNYMRSTEHGKNLVEEYYRVAPEIVKKINDSDNKNIYYNDIHQTILQCLEEIDLCNNEEALKLYKQMVDKYKRQFSI